MHTTIVDFLLFGGVDSPRPWSQEEKVTFICPVPGYDRHFSMLEEFGIEMVTVDDARRRPRHGRRRGARQGRPERQGHLDRADLRQPLRRDRVAGEGRAPRRDADGRPRLHDLLGQRLRLPPPHRGRGQERRHPQPRGRLGPPQPPDHVRVDLEDHLRRRRRRGARRQPGHRDVVARPPRPWARSAPTRSTTCGTSSSSRTPTACAPTCAATARSSRPKFAAVDAALTEGLDGPRGGASGPTRRGATSSTSTCSTAPPRASSPSPRAPASP